MMSAEYLVHHGAGGHLGRFRAAAPAAFARGDAVVVRGLRGLELGEVLCAAEGKAALPDPYVGDLLRRATADDLAAADRRREFGQRLCADAERLAAERGLPLAVVDLEVLLDGRQAILHVLRLGPCNEGPLLAELGERHGLIVRLFDLTETPAAAPDAADHLEDLGCGKENCGSGAGGCDSCGSGGSAHGGCSSCSSGAADELANYFAGLRAQMEQHQRVPLV
jgi:hypothetical protein